MVKLSDKELARQLYEPCEKLWTAMQLRMTGALRDEIRNLAARECRSLYAQLRHLVEIGLRCELARLEHEAEMAPAIASKVEREHREAVRRALAEATKREAA